MLGQRARKLAAWLTSGYAQQPGCERGAEAVWKARVACRLLNQE
jgi:hypothetical protein